MIAKRVGFLKLQITGNAIFPHLTGEITFAGVKEIQREYSILKASGKPYAIVVPIPTDNERAAQLERLCKLFGLRFWYSTAGSRVWGDWRD